MTNSQVKSQVWYSVYSIKYIMELLGPKLLCKMRIFDRIISKLFQVSTIKTFSFYIDIFTNYKGHL